METKIVRQHVSIKLQLLFSGHNMKWGSNQRPKEIDVEEFVSKFFQTCDFPCWFLDNSKFSSAMIGVKHMCDRCNVSRTQYETQRQMDRNFASEINYLIITVFLPILVISVVIYFINYLPKYLK